MASLPTLSGKETVKAFESLGWAFVRQHGSHMILKKPGHSAVLSVPDHRELAPGTLRGLIRVAGLTVKEFVDVL